MGWDANAVYENGDSIKHYESGVGIIIDDLEIRYSFAKADLAVVTICGVVDVGLKNGWLDTSVCGEAFMTLFEVDAWPEGEGGKYDLSPEQVRSLAEEHGKLVAWLRDETTVDPASQWHLYSTLAFVRVCAKHNLAIKFSY